jgi:3-dehydroquinate dehydratase / shikimate dehydrogenase
MTMIAVSIAVHEPEDVERALARAGQAVQHGAQLIEWRIDSLAGHEDALKLVQQLIRDSPAPCILTCRPVWEGGEYRGDEETRAELFERLVNGKDRPRYIDVELKAIQQHERFENLIRAAPDRDLATSFIVSTHDFDGRPRDLLQRIETMANEPGCSVMKIAWHARSLRDNLEAFELLATRQKPMVALCMGQFGLMSRILAPKFGGFLTFVTDVEAEVTAPGQPTLKELQVVYRFERIGPKTKVYGVIGWPVHHSLSPLIHNAGFAEAGHDGVYLPLPVPGNSAEYEHFKATVGALIDTPGLDFRGASATIPHKENLVRFVRERGGRMDQLTERIGAANTLVVGSAGGLECVNTDCPAAIEALCEGMHISREQLSGQRVLVLGAGGLARAVLVGLLDCATSVTVFNRNRDRAELLVAELNANASTQKQLTVASEPALSAGEFDMVINCTPVGMAGGSAPTESPLPASVILNDDVTVFETVYTPARTPLVQEAEARGARVIFGVDMFVKQAAMQFERWCGVPLPHSSIAALAAQK